MPPRLQVLVHQARNLAAKDSNGFSDPFVRLQLNKTKAKSATVYKNLNPVWNDEFLFTVNDIEKDTLEVSLWDEDFLSAPDFLGQLSIPIADVAKGEGRCLPRTWYTLKQRPTKTRYFISGEVELSIALIGNVSRAVSLAEDRPTEDEQPPETFFSGPFLQQPQAPSFSSCKSSSLPYGAAAAYLKSQDSPLSNSLHKSESAESVHETEEVDTLSSLLSDEDNPPLPKAGPANKALPPSASSRAKNLFHSLKQSVTRRSSGVSAVATPVEGTGIVSNLGQLAGGFIRSASVSPATANSATVDGSYKTVPAQNHDSLSSTDSDGTPVGQGKPLPTSWFDTCVKEPAPAGADFPVALEGGVVLEQAFGCAAHELNSTIFKPDSEFWQEFASTRKLTEVDTGPWVDERESGGVISRVVTYMTAPSSLVKSVKATEVMKFTRADQGGYLVDVVAATPDVPYGTCFETHLQFLITPGPEGGSTLRVSYKPHFLQSTMMKSMIENGMRTGIKDSYQVYLQILSKYCPPLGTVPGTPRGTPATSAEVPQAIEAPKTLLERAYTLWVPVAFLVVALSLILLPLHFLNVGSLPDGESGVVIWPLELPRSISAFLTTALVTLSAQQVYYFMKPRIIARFYAKSDAGKKACGEGWVLTVSLVEGQGVGGPGLRDLADPFVVFTCNGKTRTSSVKLKSRNPKWNEVLEFDAFDDIPSTLEVELLDYKGPFAEANPLGRVEVDHLSLSTQEVQDMWVSLEGKKARMLDTRLHLQIQLTQTSEGREKASKLLEHIKKEVGAKVVTTSAEKTQAFQKLFNLPEHEYLVGDFSCALKKGILLQGRLFLSSRHVAFHSNLFGKKTKFTVLWEDIEEMKENSPTMHSINRLLNPSITLFLKKGKGADASQAAYGIDHSGRPKIRLQSFMRSQAAFKTMQVLWTYRALPPEQQEERARKAQEEGMLPRVESSATGVLPGNEDDNAVYTGSEPPEILLTDVSEVPVTVDHFLMLIKEKNLVCKISEALGQLNVEASDWVPSEGAENQYVRNMKYTLSKKESPFGSEVSEVQRTTSGEKGKKAWAELETDITLHNVPFGDHFRVCSKRYAEQKTNRTTSVTFTVSISWLKDMPADTKETIKKDVSSYYKQQFELTRGILVREIVSAAQ